MISQNIGKRLLNITNILNNFKSFIKQVYQKGWTQLKKKGRLTFNNRENFLFF